MVILNLHTLSKVQYHYYSSIMSIMGLHVRSLLELMATLKRLRSSCDVTIELTIAKQNQKKPNSRLTEAFSRGNHTKMYKRIMEHSYRSWKRLTSVLIWYWSPNVSTNVGDDRSNSKEITVVFLNQSWHSRYHWRARGKKQRFWIWNCVSLSCASWDSSTSGLGGRHFGSNF